MALNPTRQKMLTKMQETLTDNARFHDWIYDPIRPLYVPLIWKPGMRVVADCSKGSQYIARWSDAPDPMGMHFGPYGNSSTATAHLPHLDHAYELHVGDYVTFGYLGKDHMAIVMGIIRDHNGHYLDAIMWSMGHPGAPNKYRLSYDTRSKTFLHNPVSNEAPHPLSADDKLRLKTGFWAWYQWNMGLGFWKKHGKKNKHVRPNVPKRIPLKWWKHRAHLILLRRKGRANRATTHRIKSEEK